MSENYLSVHEKLKKDIGKVVIVYPFTYINPYYALPPIAAEYLQAGVLAAGKNAVLLDMRYETDIDEHLKEADLICLYGYFEDCSIFGKWKIHIIPEVLNRIPANKLVIAGGTGFRDADEAMKLYPNVDIVIRGNPEIPIMELLEKRSPDNVKNLVYRRGDELVHTERTIHPLTEDIFPKRGLRNPKYKYHTMGIKVDLIRAAVGCNYRCRFCYQYGKDFDGNYLKWQGRSATSLFNELKEIDAPIVGWVDDDMTTDMKTLEELSDLLISHKIRKLYMGTGRLDHVIKSSVGALKKMEKAGFLALSFGVESLKKDTLRFYGKGLTIENIEKGMLMMQKTNILLICNFILGSPGETEEDIMDMLWFGRKWDVDTIVTNRFRAEKGSDMYGLVNDPLTDMQRPGMERIEGKPLERIKHKIKFGQRTPLRIMMTILKLYRHEGMFIDPLYIVLSMIETMTKYTWVEKTLVIPLFLKAAKWILSLPPVRIITRLIAIILGPLVSAVNRLCEFIDKKTGISTRVMPAIFLYMREKTYNKQKVKAQLHAKTGTSGK